MNSLERQGWRYVEGVARFGADRPEELLTWRAWLARVRAFFVATESQPRMNTEPHGLEAA